MMRFLLLLAMALLLSGCHRAPLHCRSEYLYPDYLASSQVLTPDPYDSCYYGQQIVMRWEVQRASLPLELVLHVRYGTREHATFSWPITSAKGYKIYRLINDAYWCSEGIVSFRAELYQGEAVIADWQHHLWVELIHVGEEEER